MSSRLLPTAGLAAAIAALLAAAPLSNAQSIPSQPPAPSGISVVGQGIVITQPNIARITLGVEVFDPSLSKAQASASSNMDAVVNKLKADGIADTDIRTVSYNVIPQYDQQNQNQPLLRGYQVQNLVEVKSNNVGSLGSLIDDAVASGATRVYGIRFEASDMSALKSQARDQAMQDARAQADQLARDAGVTLGRTISIEVSDTSGTTPIRAPAQAAAPAAAVSTTPIQSGELSISTTVHVVWAIQ
ncbi:MAG: SIMPL domain-containing protein [Chloroflexota bacterium]|nr:SIMPL domain-containing protein [Chloroflexota bacterium]